MELKISAVLYGITAKRAFTFVQFINRSVIEESKTTSGIRGLKKKVAKTQCGI
jgi:hypothetical protein